MSDDRGDVDDLQQRIGRALEIDQPGVAGDGGGDRVEIGEVDVAHVDAALGQDAREQAIGAAVEIIAGENFFAGTKAAASPR